MFDVCESCQKGFSVERRIRTHRKSILRKPLVAVSLLVIISMCVPLSSAAPPRGALRLRHQRHALAPRDARDIDLYKTITRRLSNTLAHLIKDIKPLNITSKTSSGNPPWLPKVNFVDIHFKKNNFKSQERRFKFLTPKLVKHLKVYREIFLRLQRVNNTAQVEWYKAKQDQDRCLYETLKNLNASITDIEDMARDDIIVPPFHPENVKFDGFFDVVDYTRRKMQDHIAYRGYKNLLKNWRMEFTCTKKRMKSKMNCIAYEERLQKRLQKKSERNA